SSTLFVCETPATSYTGSGTVRLLSNSEVQANLTSVAITNITTPNHPVTVVMEHPITVTGVVPRRVPAIGGSELHVTGTNFQNTTHLSCVFFGSLVTPATF